jgi:hypothetical protein
MSELVTGRRRPPPLATANHEQWASWIVDNTAQQSAIPFDCGLAAVAKFLGKEKALQYALDGAAAEASGDYTDAVKKYRAAFRLYRNRLTLTLTPTLTLTLTLALTLTLNLTLTLALTLTLTLTLTLGYGQLWTVTHPAGYRNWFGRRQMPMTTR